MTESTRKTRDAFLCMNCSLRKVACLYTEDDLESCIACRKSSKECTGPMSAKDRRAAGVRDFRTIRVKKDIASFVHEILEPILESGVTMTEIIDQLAERWNIFPSFEGLE